AEHAVFAVGQELRGRDLRDDTRVIPLQSRPIPGFAGRGLVDLQWSHRVATGAAADAGGETGGTAVEVDRLAAEEAGDAADFPAAYCSLGEFVARVLEEREFIDVTELQHLRAVEVRGSLPTGELLVVDKVASLLLVGAGGVIDGVRPSVHRLQGQPMTERVAEVRLEGVVAGNRRVLLHADVVVVLVGLEEIARHLLVDQERLHIAVAGSVAGGVEAETALVSGSGAMQRRNVHDTDAERNFAHVSRPREIPSQTAYIRHFQQVVSAELVLDVKVELLHVRPALAGRNGRVARRSKRSR